MNRLPAGDTTAPSQTYRSNLALLGKTQKTLPERWMVLEAIAWIATRNRDVVAGISFCIADTTVDVRPIFPDQPALAGHRAFEYLRDAIRNQFCKCLRLRVDRSAGRRWSALSAEERARAPLEQETDLAELYRDQAERHCTCFSSSADKLFRALLSGQIAALGYHAGARREVDRPDWINAGFDTSGELSLAHLGWTRITLDTQAVQAFWPATFTINGETRTLEEWETWAKSGTRGRPTQSRFVEAMFAERAKNPRSLQPKLGLEAGACVEELERRFGTHLKFPRMRSCEGYIAEAYENAMSLQKTK